MAEVNLRWRGTGAASRPRQCANQFARAQDRRRRESYPVGEPTPIRRWCPGRPIGTSQHGRKIPPGERFVKSIFDLDQDRPATIAEDVEKGQAYPEAKVELARFCERDVVTTPRDTSIRDAAALMRKYHVGSLVIVDSDEDESALVGVVTDRDLVVEVLAQDVTIESLSVGDIVQTPLETVDETMDVWEALECMAELGVRRLPVVDSQSYLRGIITLDDIIEWFAESMDRMRPLVSNEIWQETRARR